MVVVGGSPQTPGALILAGQAALSAGAGKLRLVTVPQTAPALAAAVPEARVFGALDRRTVAAATAGSQAVLLGPGLLQGWRARQLLQWLRGQTLVLDAMALRVFRPNSYRPAVLTPHHGELAALLGVDALTEPCVAARQAAAEAGCVVVAKGPTTWIAAPDGRCLCHQGSDPGLATSGSGDVLAGLITGLLARGCAPLQAAAWGVHLHAARARALGEPGYLARQLI